MAVTASMSSGCLIEDPPPFTQPEQTPPRLDLVAAFPPADQVIVRNTGDTVDFSVPVFSEDAGDRLRGVLLLDVGSPNEFSLSRSPVPASTLDDFERELTLSWEIRGFVTSGCHRVTLRVSHEQNFGKDDEVVDPKDVAVAHWMANINPENATTLVNCPNASTGGQ
jgi:hypothetical protein